jgi:WD40 repeat protein
VSKDLARAPSRAGLLDWQRFLRADSHILRESPELLFQQAANQPEKTAPAWDAAARIAAGKATRAWLRWVNKPQLPDPCLLTVGGELERINCGCFLPGGTRVLAASESELQVWDIEAGARLGTIPVAGEGIRSCFSTPDGGTILFIGPRGLIAFDGERLSERFRLEDESGGGRWIVSPDGRLAAGINQNSSRVKLWDLDERRLVLERAGETDPRRPVLFGAGGRRAVIRWRTGHELVDSTSGTVVAGLEGNACAAEGRLVVSITRENTLTLWDAGTGDRLRTIAVGRSVHRCSIAPGAKRLLADVIVQDVLDKVVWAHYLLDVESGDLAAALPSGYGDHVTVLQENQTGAVPSVSLPGHAFWPDGRRLAAWPPYATDVTVWDAETGEWMGTLTAHPHWVQSCAVSSAGEFLSAVCQDGSLVVWDGRDLCRRATLRGNARPIIDLFYSPDVTHLAGASEDGTFRIWKIPESDETEASTHKGRVTVCVFSARGDRLLSGGMDGLLMLRNPDSGERVDGLDARQGGIPAAALSPAGDQVAFIAGQPYAGARVWNTKTGQVDSLGDVGHGEEGGRCRFSPDGRHLVAVGGSLHGFSVHTGKISIWRTDPWLEVFSREYGAPVGRFELTLDSRWALFNLQDGTFLQWDFRGGPGAAMKETKGVRAFAVPPSSQAVLLTLRGPGAAVMHLESQAVWNIPLPTESLGSWRGFSPDGRRVASWPCRVAELDPQASTINLAWEAPSEYFLAFSEDGEYVAACTGIEAVVLRRAGDGSQISKYYPRGAFNQIDLAPGGRKLAVGTMLGEVHLLCLEGWPPKRAAAARAASGRPAGKNTKRIGLNDPCPCGSGKKYRKCHGAA